MYTLKFIDCRYSVRADGKTVAAFDSVEMGEALLPEITKIAEADYKKRGIANKPEIKVLKHW